MLSLARQIEREVTQLEKQTFQADKSIFKAWQDILTWKFFCHKHKDKSEEIYNSLPENHPIKPTYYALSWQACLFYSHLPHSGQSWERVVLTLDSLLTQLIEEGFTQRQLGTVANMRDTLALADNILADKENWLDYYEQKEQEAAYREKWVQCRMDDYNGVLSAEDEQWLQQNDKEWKMKKQQQLDGQSLLAIKQVFRQALNEPTETTEQRHERLAQQVEAKGLFLPEQQSRREEIEQWVNQKQNGSVENLSAESVVTVAYFGRMAGIHLTLSDGSQTEVKPMTPYQVSSSTWEKLQQPPFRTGDWKRLID